VSLTKTKAHSGTGAENRPRRRRGRVPALGDPRERFGSPIALMRAVQGAVGVEAPMPGPSARKRHEAPRGAKRDARPRTAAHPRTRSAAGSRTRSHETARS
jgi:hypothetical protein